MKNMLRTTAVAGAGLLVVTLALTTDGARVAAQGMKPILVQVMNTAAEPVPVVSPVDRVLLREQGGPPTGVCPDFAREVERILPDGAFVRSYTVPPGKMLVLTDLEALLEERSDLQWSVGDIARATAFGGSAGPAVIRGHGPLSADAVTAGVVAAITHLETGGVIGPNIAVCVAGGIDRIHGGYAADLAQARLYGYLIDE